MNQESKKILIATPLYPPESGGPATYSKLLEDYLPARGFPVELLAFSTVRHLPKGIRHVAYFWRCFRLARTADVVYALDPVSVGLPSALAAMLTGKKFIVRVPGDYAWEQGRQRFGVKDELDEFQDKHYNFRTELLRRTQRFVVRRARLVIVPSEYMERVVSGWCDPARVHVVYSSIPLKVVAEPPTGRPAGFLIVSIARPVPWKGLDALRRVAARDTRWQLRIFNDLPHAQAMGWIQTADVFVLNSTYEGLSHLLIEAMALGTPTIATRVGGNPEVIEGCGILIPPKDDEALYAALQTVYNNPELAREGARRGMERAKKFDIEVALEKLTGFLHKL